MSTRPLSGLFISFEGMDGAGKSTHIAGLAEAFKAEGRAVTLTREPGGTPLAEKLRAMVLNDAMDPLTEALLIFAARRDHIVNVIAPALLRGDVVLCDRFTDATFAYQGAGRGFDLKLLATLEQWVQSDEGLLGDPAGNSPMKPEVETVIEPHLTVWFDLAPEEAARAWPARACPTNSRPSRWNFSAAWRKAMPTGRKTTPNASHASTPPKAATRSGRLCARSLWPRAGCHERHRHRERPGRIQQPAPGALAANPA